MKIEVIGIEEVSSKIDKMENTLDGEVFIDVAREMETDVGSSGRGWPTTSVKNNLNSIIEKDGIQIIFNSSSSKYPMNSLSRVFIKTLKNNLSKYIKMLEKKWQSK